MNIYDVFYWIVAGALMISLLVALLLGLKKAYEYLFNEFGLLKKKIQKKDMVDGTLVVSEGVANAQ